jgi:hypothetical protein
MTFVLVCLAVWRICHFIANEDGPWAFMYNIREWVYAREWFEVHYLMTCVKCNSVWVSFMFVPFCFREHQFLSWLAVSATACLLEALHAVLRREKEVQS